MFQVHSFYKLSHTSGKALLKQLTLTISAPVSSPTSIFLSVTLIKLVGSPNVMLVVSVIWSITGSLIGLSRHVGVLYYPRKIYLIIGV